jgi:putative FmdB family regulatory protein
MPIYEYKCDKCGIFEASQRIVEPALKKCPTCKSKVERIISLSSFVLKGSGWYATDYARAGKPKSEGGDSSAPAGDTAANGASDGAKSEGSKSDGAKSKSSTDSSASAPVKSTAKSESATGKTAD